MGFFELILEHFKLKFKIFELNCVNFNLNDRRSAFGYYTNNCK